jgi:hypothetical protein
MTTRAHDSDPSGSSHAGAQPFAGLGAGLGFFQDWMKAAGAALPGMSAPAGAGTLKSWTNASRSSRPCSSGWSKTAG